MFRLILSMILFSLIITGNYRRSRGVEASGLRLNALKVRGFDPAPLQPRLAHVFTGAVHISCLATGLFREEEQLNKSGVWSSESLYLRRTYALPKPSLDACELDIRESP